MRAQFSAGDIRVGQVFQQSLYVAEIADPKRPHVLCACGRLAQISASALLDGSASCTCTFAEPVAHRRPPFLAERN